MLRNKLIISIRTVFFSTIFLMGFFLTYHQAFALDASKNNGVELSNHHGYASDLIPHIEIVTQYFNGEIYIPHPLWHILVKGVSYITSLSIEYSAIMVSALLITVWACLIGFVIRVLLQDTIKMYTPLMQEMIVLLLLSSIFVVGPLVIPWYNKLIYKGVGSPNIWHNVTLWTVKPLALMSILFSVWAFQEHKLKYYIYAVLAIIISIFAKPSFIIVFLPALFILMLYKHYTLRSDIYFFSIVSIFSLMILLYQYTGTFGENSEGVKIDILGVWSLAANNILMSIFLALAFPLLFLKLYPKSLDNDYLILAWLQVLFGIVLYAVFVEQGTRDGHANFSWSYQIGLTMLYLFSIIEFVKNFFILNLWKRSLLSIVLSLQILIGLYYLVKVLEGENPMYIAVCI